MQVDRHQWDADQTDMDPPLSHLELSGVGGGLIPASKRWESHATTKDRATDQGQSQQVRELWRSVYSRLTLPPPPLYTVIHYNTL